MTLRLSARRVWPDGVIDLDRLPEQYPRNSTRGKGNAMTISSSSISAPGRMNFAASGARPAAVTKAEKTLAGMLSPTFIADAAALVTPAYSGYVSEGLTELHKDLLAGLPISTIKQDVAGYFGLLGEAGVVSPYDYTAGKAVAKAITTADANALYSLLPAGLVTKANFETDIGVLKTDLKTGLGFSELSQL